MDDEKTVVLIDNNNVLQIKGLDEIVYLESFGKKTKTHCNNGNEYLIKKCLSSVEEELPGEKFFKIHKSFIINIDYLRGINVNENKTVLLHDEIELKIAHRKYKDFMDYLKNRFEFWV